MNGHSLSLHLQSCCPLRPKAPTHGVRLGYLTDRNIMVLVCSGRHCASEYSWGPHAGTPHERAALRSQFSHGPRNTMSTVAAEAFNWDL